MADPDPIRPGAGEGDKRKFDGVWMKQSKVEHAKEVVCQARVETQPVNQYEES